MMVALGDLARIAPSVGFPSDRKRLKEQLRRLGANPRIGTVRRNQVGNLYEVADLPEQFQGAVSVPPTAREETSKATDPALAGRYVNAAPSLRREADRRHNVVWHVRRSMHDGASLNAAAAAAAEKFGGDASSAKRHWREVRTRPDAEWLDALVPAYRGRAKAEIDARIWAAFVEDYGRVEQPSAEACYGRLCRLATARGWPAAPTLKTLKRRWEALPVDFRRLRREGERSLLDSLPHQERDRSGMRPLDSWNMDSRLWDIFVLLENLRVVRLVVTLAQDEATNFIVGYEVTEAETAASYRRVLCGAFEAWGIPGKVRFDNTRAAANKKLTAGTKARFRFTDRPDDVEGLLPRLGVDVAFAQPFNGRAKLVERAFADLKERTEKDPRLAGAYTGRSPAEKPANYGSRAVPLALFCQVLAEGIAEYNARTGRRSAVASCYQTAFEAGLRDRPVRRLTAAQRRLFFLTAERMTVTPAGTILIRLRGERRPHRYGFVSGSDALRDHAGRDVIVRYDENDLSAPVMVETPDGCLIAAEVPRIEAGAFGSAEAAGAHARERRKVVKATKAIDASYARMDGLESGTSPPTIAGPPAAPAISVRVVRGEFRRHPSRTPTPTPPPHAEPQDNHDWRELTDVELLADELRRGAA